MEWKVIQGVNPESSPLGELKKLSENRNLLFDEELMITLEDANGNRKLYKKRYEHKIDVVDALMDAFIAYNNSEEDLHNLGI